MRVFVLDEKPSHATYLGAIFCADSLELLSRHQPRSTDAVVINMDAVDPNQRGSAGDPPWGSKWTRLIAEVRRLFDGPIVVIHGVAPTEAATRLILALGAPGFVPLHLDPSRPADLLEAWGAVGITFTTDPIDAADIAGSKPPRADAIDWLRFRLQLIDALQDMRTTWHRATNRRAALRILGGAVMSWIEDAAARGRETQPRGLSPQAALDILHQWSTDLRSQGGDDQHLSALAETLRKLTRSQRIQRLQRQWTTETRECHRAAVLIDDEATTSGWTRLLRAILSSRFGVALPDHNVVLDLAAAEAKVNDASWLDDTDLVLLDISFPDRPTGGMQVLDRIVHSTHPVPIIMFSALTSGVVVRRSLELGAGYFFKEYSDDQNVVDYYRQLEEAVATAVARTPRLVAGRRWSCAMTTARKLGDLAINAAEPWVEQALELLDPNQLPPSRAGSAYLAVISAGVALEQYLEEARRAIQKSLGGYPADANDDDRGETMRIIARPDLAQRIPGRTSAPEFFVPEYPTDLIVGPDRVRLKSGVVVRMMRNAVVHARISPSTVDDSDALIVLLALALFVSGEITDEILARRIFNPLYQHRGRRDTIGLAPWRGDTVDLKRLDALCLALRGRAQSIEQRARRALSPKHSGQLRPSIRAAIYAMILAAIADLSPRTDANGLVRVHEHVQVSTEMALLIDLCWNRILELEPSVLSTVEKHAT